MKRLIIAALSIMFVFAGCQNPSLQNPVSSSESFASETLFLRLVDGADTGTILLAGNGENDIYSLDVADAEIFLDGNRSDPSVLQDGMMCEITCYEPLTDSFPVQLAPASSLKVYSRGTAENPGGSYYDICGLYLQVLEDLWDSDSGLNNDIKYISVDLSDAPGELSEGEKSAIAYAFASKHGCKALSLSYNGLIENGYLNEAESMSSPPAPSGIYDWEDGLLFSISSGEYDTNEFYSLPVIKFNALKWRSPLGAYSFLDCMAVWPQMGTWSTYKIGAEAIS